jgi:tetraacyldisaccharide 4'-kinase
MPLADSLQKTWYDDLSPSWLLRAPAALYAAVTRWRVAWYRRGWLASERLPVPVVVVGNITVGGTGKTPLTIALVDFLREHGWHPGVVSRGHGGRQRLPALLGNAPDPVEVGDEPCLIRRRTGVPVAVGRDRPAAARLLVEAGVDVVLADDGLQHYRLQRDIEICVIDGLRRFGNKRLLPAGPLREPLARLDGVDFRVCNGGLPRDDEILMRLFGDRARNLRVRADERPLRTFARQRVHAVAGIGHPQRFFDSLRAQQIDVIEHAFADHHAYLADDLDFGDDLPVLMTGKDAIKCVAFTQPHWWCVPVRALLPDAFLDELDARLQLLRQ